MLQTHQRTEVAASFRQELAKPSPLEPNQVARVSQKVEGDMSYPTALLLNAHAIRVCHLLCCSQWGYYSKGPDYCAQAVRAPLNLTGTGNKLHASCICMHVALCNACCRYPLKGLFAWVV